MKRIYILALAAITSLTVNAQSQMKVKLNKKKGVQASTIKNGFSNGSVQALSGSIVCNTPYIAGSTMDLQFTIQLTNTDFEYGDSVAITFPAGITPNTSANNSNPICSDAADPGADGPEALNGVNGQVITWGNNDNTWGGVVPGAAYNFTVNVTVSAGLTGNQTANYHVSGDQYANPADLNGTLTINQGATAQTARLQAIHNCADAAAATVDVWVNSGPTGLIKLIDDFAFRTASPFVDVPAGTPLRVLICPPTSTDTSAVIIGFNYNLAAGSKYILTASGVVSPTGYNPSPAFNLEVNAIAQESASLPANTDVLVFHGSTDAPTVDVVAPFVGTLVNDLNYASYSNGYLQLPTADYSVQIRNAAGTDVVAQYAAPLSTLGLNGQALVVVASGFLNPANNSNGPAFGLYVALPSGGALIPLPTQSVSTTRLQVIHNCADAAAASVDVWAYSAPTGLIKLIDDFGFRTATPFVDVPAGTQLRVLICPPTSTDTSAVIVGFNYNLSSSSKYILTANGIVVSAGFNPAPAFELTAFASGLELGTNASNTDVLVIHGSTDAPIVDVQAVGAGTIINDLAYAQYNPAGYLSLPTADYTINIADQTGTTVVASYLAPLQTLNLQGQALTVVASGFLNPAANNNGPSFGLWVALPSGGNLIPLPAVTGINENSASSIKFFPNPVSDNLTINSESNIKSIRITDLQGRNVMSLSIDQKNTIIDLSSLNNGMYLIEMNTEKGIIIERLVK